MKFIVNINTFQVLCVVFLASFLTKDYTQALKAAQKAVHCYPDVAVSWISLISVLKILKEKFSNLWLQKLAVHVQKHLNPSSAILEWLQGQILIKRNQ